MDQGPIIPKHSAVRFLLVICILFLLLNRLDYLPLKFEEPRRALVAAEMMISGNYWAPTINGAFYYNKPPLFNWLLVGAFQLFGFENWVERLPTFLSIIGVSLITYFFFRKRIGEETAQLASLFLVLSGHMLFYFSFQGEIDMTYSFIVVLQAICLFHFFDKRKWLLLFGSSYLLMVVGFLMKGIPSIAFQGLTILGLFVWHKEYKNLFHPAHFIALLSSAFLLIGYFSLYSDYNDPELLIVKLTVESSRRTTEATSILDYFLQLVRFPLLLVLIMLPGSLLFPFARNLRKRIAENKWIRYSFLFILFNIPLYWISPGVRDRYLYMFLPFLYLILFHCSIDTIRKHTGLIRVIFQVLASLIAFGLLALPFVRSDVSFIWSMITFLIICLIIFLSWKRKIHPVFGALLLMMMLRFFYDRVVFPIRGQSPDNIAATHHADQVLEITSGKDLFFLGDSFEKELKLPFRKPVTIEEIERLPYQFSYYYTAASGRIINWTNEIPTDNYFVTESKNFSEEKAVYDFEMEGRRFVLVKP